MTGSGMVIENESTVVDAAGNVYVRMVGDACVFLGTVQCALTHAPFAHHGAKLRTR